MVNIAWAFSKLGFVHPPLFHAISQQAIRLCGCIECEVQSLANIAWAFSSLEIDDLPLFKSIAS
jgi:hypothetical protein